MGEPKQFQTEGTQAQKNELREMKEPDFLLSFQEYFCLKADATEERLITSIEACPQIKILVKKGLERRNYAASRIEVIADSPHFNRLGFLQINFGEEPARVIRYRNLVGNTYTNQDKLKKAYFSLINRIRAAYNKDKTLVIKNLKGIIED